MPCLHPKTILNPRYKEGGWKKRIIYCRDYFGFENSILQREPNGSLSWYPPDYYIQVPCGRCSECRKSKRNGWSIRLMKEIRCHKECIFVTLTIDNAHYEQICENPKRALMLYIDRLRKSLGFRPRYFFVSELGDDTERLHFHGIFFGTSKKTLSFALQRKKWKYGVSWLGYCNDATANYIVKYMLKDTKDYKPFVLCSNGIGSSYVTEKTIEKHINGFDPIFYINHCGVKYPLPPYYRNKMFSDELKALFLVNRLNDFTPFERTFNGHIFNDEISYRRALTDFYSWSLSQKLSLPDKTIDKNLFNFNPYLYYGTICFPESRASGYQAFQTRFKFV